MTFQDIVPPAPRRSIRDVPLPGDRRPRPTATKKRVSDHLPPASTRDSSLGGPPPPPPLPTKMPPQREPEPEWLAPKERRSRFGLWSIVVIAVVVLFFGISFLFAKATVKVTPKIQEVAVNQTLSANQKKDSTTLATGTIPYALITLEKEAGTDAPGTGEAVTVSQKASGQIIIYNNYSSTPQPLVATTRFATPDGLVYRIDKDITVPGQKTVDGKVSPGSVEATVYADQGGEKYNVGLKDFTIPGFQGTPKATGFYARSKTALAGGFTGTTKKVSEQDLVLAHAKIEGELGRDILQQAKAQKPDNFVLFDGAVITRFSALPNGSSTVNGMVSVREKATGYAIVFDRDILSSYIASAFGQTQTTSSSTLQGLDNLSFNLLNKANFPSASSTAISFSLSGKVNAVPAVDEQKLKNDLAGLSRSKMKEVLANHPSIEKVDVVYRPLWLWSFPKDSADIEVDILTP